MGAFGRLLQSHFGGTIHDVSYWPDKSKAKYDTRENPNSVMLQEDSRLLTQIKSDIFHKQYSKDENR